MSLHLVQLLALCGAIVVYALCREWLFRWWTLRLRSGQALRKTSGRE